MSKQERRLPLPPMDVMAVVVCTAVIFFVLAFGGKALETYRLQRHNARLRAQKIALQQEKAELEARLTHVQSSEYVEKVAREQYRWAKPGEKLVIPILQQGSPGSWPADQVPSGTVTSSSQSACHWSEWWGFVARSFDKR